MVITKDNLSQACAIIAALTSLLAGAHEVYAQPQDPEQPRAGLPLSTEQAQEFQRKAEEEHQAQLEKEQAERRRSSRGMLFQLTDALNEGDLTLAAHSVEGEHDWGQLRRITLALRRPYNIRIFQVLPLFAQAPEGKDEFEARVAVVVDRQDPLNLTDDVLLRDKETFIENLTLRRGADREWKIVPRPQSPAPPPAQGTTVQAQLDEYEARIKAAQAESDGFLNTWARALVQPRVLLFNTVSQASVSNLRQVLLGVMQFTQDNGEKLTFTPIDFVEKLQPYVKTREIFTAPVLDEDTPFAYRLNPAIVGQGLAAFRELARTVAIYEADAQGKPLFRFAGKAVIGFMDGHVKLTTPEEVKALMWQP